MTVRVASKRFGPEELLTAPRRSSAKPSPDGKLAILTQSVYSFDSHTKRSEIAVIDVQTSDITVLSKDSKASEPTWLGSEHELVWLKEGDNGNTSVVIADADVAGKTYVAGMIPGPVSSLKVKRVKDDMVAIAVAGKATPDGSLYNPKDSPKPHTSAKVYDALFARHWDTYITQSRNSIFTAVLKKSPARVAGRQGHYHLLGFTNALKGTGLECPIPPFGGTDHFDLDTDGLVIVAKDPEINPATHTKCSAWWIPKEDLMIDMAEPKPQKLDIPGFDGAATSPVIANSGKLAFLQMREDGYEADRNEIIVFLDIGWKASPRTCEGQAICSTIAGGGWDRSASSLTWSNDGTMLYVQAEDKGSNCLYMLTVPPENPSSIRQLTTKFSVTDVAQLGPRSPFLLCSANSLVDNSFYFLLNPFTEKHIEIVPLSSSSRSGKEFGLSHDQVSSLWWKGDNDHPVHAWMVVPSNFKKDKKYPLAFFVHGGPQGAWTDSWSTRWNPAVFAEQGYVVVAPNPTGSTGYGQAFTDAIKNNWGGSPYIDLVKGVEYIEKELDFVDMDRAVALGGSYGGFMMNWIQGHDLAHKFKALVNHDGVFSMAGQLASEEQYFPVHDFGGTYWERREMYDKWDPSRHLEKWETPMLIIHSDLDYRLTVAEGLSAFNVLQMKGIESRFLTFPDENHWVLKYENSLAWHLVVLNWINSYVGLPKIKDREGRDGSEFVMQPKRKVPSDK